MKKEERVDKNHKRKKREVLYQEKEKNPQEEERGVTKKQLWGKG